MEVSPGWGLKVSGGVAPQPVVVAGEELLTVTPAGRVSVSEKFVRPVSPGAVTSIRKRELPPAVIVGGLNDFAPVTSEPNTRMSPFAGRGLPTP